jgi:hypothetical protein
VNRAAAARTSGSDGVLVLAILRMRVSHLRQGVILSGLHAVKVRDELVGSRKDSTQGMFQKVQIRLIESGRTRLGRFCSTFSNNILITSKHRR